MKEIRIKISTLLVAVSIIILILIGLIFKLYGKQLTQVENYLITIIITLLSIFISWYVSKRSVRFEVMEGFKGETGKAYRRSKIAVQKIGAVIDIVMSRLGVYKQGIESGNKEAILEVFRNISGQLVGLKSDMEASMSDWEDIIPEYIKKDKDLIREIEKIKEQARNDQLVLLKKIEEIQKSKSIDDKKKQSQIDLLQVQLSTLENKMLSEVRQIDPLVATGITASDFGSTGVYIQPSNNLLSSMGLTNNQDSVFLNSGILDTPLAHTVKVDDFTAVKPLYKEELGKITPLDTDTITISPKSKTSKDEKHSELKQK